MIIRPTPRLCLLLIIGAMSTCAGCNVVRNLSPMNQDALLSHRQEQDQVSARPDELPSESQMCIETARSVAAAGHAREAMLLFEKAERLSQKPLHRELAPLYAQLGQTDKAIDRYRQAFAGASDDVELRNNFAWTLLEAGKLQESIDVAQQGLADSPNHPRLMSTLAVAQFKLGNRQAAFELFRSAFGESAAHHNLAMLEIDGGNEGQAKHHLAQAVESPRSTPESKQFHQALTR